MLANALLSTVLLLTNVDVGKPGASSERLQPEQGCLGSSLDDCFDVLRFWIHVPDEKIASAMARLEEVDVNGRRTRSGDRFSLDGQFGESPLAIANVTITFNKRRVVTEIEVSGLHDFTRARTTEEYRKTRLYETIQIIFGSSCPNTEEDALFRFFENHVKPRVKRVPVKHEFSWNRAEEDHFSEAHNMAFCGRRISYDSLFSYSSDSVDADNPDGAIFVANITAK